MAPYRAVSGGVVADVLSGLRCSHVRPFRRKAATDATVLAQVLAGPSGQDLRAVCDLAVLCFGRAFCLRRSKLVVLRAEDLDRVSEGLRVTVRCCKTDQKGRRTMVVVPQGRSLRPMVALETSPRAAGITERPVFQLWRRSCAIRTPDLLPTSRVIANRSRALAQAVDHPELHHQHGTAMRLAEDEGSARTTSADPEDRFGSMQRTYSSDHQSRSRPRLSRAGGTGVTGLSPIRALRTAQPLRRAEGRSYEAIVPLDANITEM